MFVGAVALLHSVVISVNVADPLVHPALLPAIPPIVILTGVLKLSSMSVPILITTSIVPSVTLNVLALTVGNVNSPSQESPPIITVPASISTL